MIKVWKGYININLMGYMPGILPGACYLMPAQRRTVFVQNNQHCQPYFISLPNLLFTCCGYSPYVTLLLVNMIPTTEFTPETTLFPPPFPNSFSYGTVCLGNDINNLDNLTHEELITAYFESSFDSVFLTGVLRSSEDNNVNSFNQWAEVTRNYPEFGKHLKFETWRRLWRFSEIIAPPPKVPAYSTVKNLDNQVGQVVHIQFSQSVLHYLVRFQDGNITSYLDRSITAIMP